MIVIIINYIINYKGNQYCYLYACNLDEIQTALKSSIKKN